MSTQKIQGAPVSLQVVMFLGSRPVDEILREKHEELMRQVAKAQAAGNDDLCLQLMRTIMPIRRALQVAYNRHES